MSDQPQQPQKSGPSISLIAPIAATFLVFFAATFLKEQADVVSLEASEKAHSAEDENEFKLMQAQIDRREQALAAQQLRQDTDITRIRDDHERLNHDLGKLATKTAEAGAQNAAGVAEVKARTDMINARLESLLTKLDNFNFSQGKHQ